MSALSYTTGNWNVTDMIIDTIQTPKNVSVPDVDWSNDFVVAKDPDGSECVLKNITGSGLVSPESVRFGRSAIADVYRGTDIPSASRALAKDGVRTLAEVKLNLMATNTVSGDEIILPIKAWMCIDLPTAQPITGQAVDYALKRAVGILFKTGSVTNALELGLARGDLNPQS